MHLQCCPILYSVACYFYSLILSAHSLLRSAMLDIVSDLLCSMPDEKLSSEHSLSLGLLLASFTCGTDEAAIAVGEGKKRDTNVNILAVLT